MGLWWAINPTISVLKRKGRFETQRYTAKKTMCRQRQRLMLSNHRPRNAKDCW